MDFISENNKRDAHLIFVIALVVVQNRFLDWYAIIVNRRRVEKYAIPTTTRGI